MKNTLGKTLRGAFAKAGALMSVGMTTMMTSLTAFADGESSQVGSVNLDSVTAPVLGLMDSVLNVMIPLVAAVGAIFCVFLGIKYSKAEEPQEREKAKGHLKSAIIGFVLIFVLVVALKIATPIMQTWMSTNAQSSAN